jgi:prepilin-type N-terminal cleavage/methylation domain-containing protein
VKRFSCLAKRGFTLLELLVSIAVFAITASIAYAIYDSVFWVVSNVDQGAGFNRRAQVVFEQMNIDLIGLYKGRSGFLRGNEVEVKNAEEPVLQFTSSAHLVFDPTAMPVSLTTVGYYLRADQGTRALALYRSDQPFNFGAGDAVENRSRMLLLCENVAAFSVTYVDAAGRELKRWQPRSAGLKTNPEDRFFPALIRVELVLRDGSGGQGKQRTYRSSMQVRPAVLGKTLEIAEPERG